MSSKTIYKHGTGRPPKLLTDFIKKANIKYNNKFDYSLVNYRHSKSSIDIICPIHGIFSTKPCEHLRDRTVYSCPSCATVAKNDKISSKYNQFIAESTLIHNNKYDYSKVEYSSNNTKVNIICPFHGDFLQSPYLHMQGQGCPLCAKNHKKTTEQFINQAKDVHNNFYDYSITMYINDSSNVEIICPIHGIFSQCANTHINGHGCPSCSNGKRQSKISLTWLKSLNIPTIIEEYQLPENKRISVDGYDPSTNTIYQFHGAYHHGDPRVFPPEKFSKRHKKTFGELYTETKLKDMQLICWGYNLIVMWEYDWKLR